MQRRQRARLRLELVKRLNLRAQLGPLASVTLRSLDLQQHAHERDQELQVFRGRLERAERIELARQPARVQLEVQVGSADQFGQLAVGPAQVQDAHARVVLAALGEQEVEQEALARAGRADHQRVRNVAGMRRVIERRAPAGLEDRQVLVAEMLVARLALRHRPQRRQVGRDRGAEVRVAQLPPVVAGSHGKPRVQAVVGLAVKAGVSGRCDPQQFRSHRFYMGPLAAAQHHAQAVLAKRHAIDLELPQRLSELHRLGLRRPVLQGSLRLRRRVTGRGVRQHAVALLVVVPASGAHPPAGLGRVFPAPLAGEVELGVQIEDLAEKVGARCRRRVQQGIGFDAFGIQQQVVAVALDIAEGKLPVQAVRGDGPGFEGGRAGVGGERQGSEQTLALQGLQVCDVIDQAAERRHRTLESETSAVNVRGQHLLGALWRQPERHTRKQRASGGPAASRRRRRSQLGIPCPEHVDLDRIQPLVQEVGAPHAARSFCQRIGGNPLRERVKPPLADLPANAPARCQALQRPRPAQADVIKIGSCPALEGRSGESRAGEQLAALGHHDAVVHESQPRKLAVQRGGSAFRHLSVSATICNGAGLSARRAGS